MRPSPSPICAYRLAKKNSGMKQIIMMKRTAFSEAKPRSLKMRIWISGSSVRSSKRTKAASRASPATMEPMVAALSQPQVLACCSPSTASPMPAVIMSAPR